MITKTPWFFHPIAVFVFSIIALAMSLFLYIYWYIEVSSGIQMMARYYKLKPDQFLEARTWMVILVLSILVGIILAGTLIIFVYSQKMARLNRLQHEFINNFTHELKTPLTSLKLYLETFFQHNLPREEQLTYLRYMILDAQRLADNISRILDLARLESKTFTGEFILVDLLETARQFLQKNSHLFEKCEIQIHRGPDTSYPYRINIALFEMLLMNMLINSIKYNRNTTPRINIRFFYSKRTLNINFEDNGIGVKTSERKKIFRKFYQTAGTLESIVPQGSGLGLYLVQNIARIHRGKMVAEKHPSEKGASFSLLLPLRHAHG